MGEGPDPLAGVKIWAGKVLKNHPRIAKIVGGLAVVVLVLGVVAEVASNWTVLEALSTRWTNESPALDPAAVSFVEYFETLEGFGDRYYEKQQFLDGLVGSRVTWKGTIVHVDRVDSLDSVGILIRPISGKALQSAYVLFPASWETRLFSLRAGDVVTVGGFVNEMAMEFQPYVDGVALSRERRSGDTAITSEAPPL